MPFDQFCQQIIKYDLFLDLRDIDFENTRCLPIKLFYYLACGRPSIYSNLSAIKKGIPEITQCTKLVNNHAEAIDALKDYIYNKSLYQAHCNNALHWAKEKYNWERIKHHFIQLIHDI
jgi:glycosyltransferase involved in cell wall biosynthesis